MSKRLDVEIQEFERVQVRMLADLLDERNLTEIEIKVGQHSIRVQRRLNSEGVSEEVL